MNNKTYIFTYETKPTEKNINYMFQRFVTPIIISMQYLPYKNYWDDYEKLFAIVKNWIGIYFNTNSLSSISIEEMNNVDSIINDLKFNCLEIETKYIEEIDVWHSEFLELWKETFVNKKGENK